MRPVWNKMSTPGWIQMLCVWDFMHTWLAHTSLCSILALLSESLCTSSPSPPNSVLRPPPSPLWLPVSGPSRWSEGAGVGLRPGSGTLSWAGEDRAESQQHRAALMKGQAAGRPPGYADHGLIGLMRCSVASARSGTAGRSGTKRGGEAYCWALWVRQRKGLLSLPEFVFLKLKMLTSAVENSLCGHWKGLKSFRWNVKMVGKTKHSNQWFIITTK